MRALVPMLALLAAPAAAQEARTYYASETWPVSASGRSCTMTFAGDLSENDPLSISYDGARGELALTSDGATVSSLGSSGTVDLRIVFLENGRTAYDDGWGSRRFTFSRDNGSARFTTRFAGERNVRQILQDLGNSAKVGFLFGDEVVMSSSLAGARESLSRLRECAARQVAAN
jgi:hypothetical protein